MPNRRYSIPSEPIHLMYTVKSLNPSNWLIGDYLLTRGPQSENATFNIPEEDAGYTLTHESALKDGFPKEVPHPKPDFELVSAHGSRGPLRGAFFLNKYICCKIVRQFVFDGTSEKTTLEYIRSKKPSFEVPEPFAEVICGKRSYLLMRRLPGDTLGEVWYKLAPEWKRKYIERIAEICKEMSEWKRDKIESVDGGKICDGFPCLFPFELEEIRSNFAQTMDISEPFFQQNDFCPHNFLVQNPPSTDTVAVVDFENSGFLPRRWLTTRLMLQRDPDYEDWYKKKKKISYVEGLSQALRKQGFEEAIDSEFLDWMVKWRKTILY